MLNASPGPEFEDVDFDIEKETWNIYELADGSTVRVRTVMIKLLKNTTATPTQLAYAGAFANLSSVRGPPRTKGIPANKIYSQEELGKFPKGEVGFSPVLEDWNVYRLKDGTRIKVKLVVSLVQKVKDVYDQFGDPMYIVNSSNVISPVPKK